MTEQELQAIKEQLTNVPEGWTFKEGARIIEGLKVSANYLVAEVTFLHSQRDGQAMLITELREQLDRTELAEAKARMEVEQLTKALQKIHTEFAALAMTTEMNQAQLLEQLERLQQTSIFRALAEIDRLRAVLEFYADEKNFVTFDSAAIKDGGRKARKALEGCRNEQG